MTHWYDATGQRVHSASDLTALGLGYLPGITSVLRVISQPRIAEFSTRQAIAMSRFTMTKDGETDWQYATRVMADSRAKQLSVTAFGDVLHANIARHNRDSSLAPDLDCDAWVWQWQQWSLENLLSVHEVEHPFASSKLGFGATIDLAATHREHGLCLIDFKSQAVKGKARFWPNFCWQLAGQAALYAEAKQLVAPPAIMSVVIDSSNSSAPVHARRWTLEEQSSGLQVCVAAAKIWLLQKHIRE